MMVEARLPTKNRLPVGRLGNGSPFFFYDASSTAVSTRLSVATRRLRTIRSKPNLVRRFFDSALPFSVFPCVHADSVPPSN